MSHRKEQIESTLKRVISQVLSKGLSDPRVSGIVSVTHVDVTPDLHDANVYVSVIPQQAQRRTVQGLSHAAGYISSIVRREMVMRSIPHLRFRLDETLKKQAQVFDAIEAGLAQDQQNQNVGDDSATVKTQYTETKMTTEGAHWEDDSA